jgi:hypothetical protein
MHTAADDRGYPGVRGALGFRRVHDWSDGSFGESFARLTYQYDCSEHWCLAATGRVRFPTERWDQPNNLVDAPTGFAAWGLGLELHQDVVWQHSGPAQRLGVLTAGEFFLNTIFHDEALLPDDKPFRVCDIHQPMCPDFDPHVHRDVGNSVEAEIAVAVGLLPGLTITPSRHEHML